MKRLLMIMICILFIAGCESGNQGYGYNTTSDADWKQRNSESFSRAVPDQKTKQPDFFEVAEQRRKNNHMTLRGLDGKAYSSCTVYKGEWDGHTWYVFYDNLAAPAVVHDPCCKCMKSKNESYGD